MGIVKPVGDWNVKLSDDSYASNNGPFLWGSNWAVSVFRGCAVNKQLLTTYTYRISSKVK